MTERAEDQAGEVSSPAGAAAVKELPVTARGVRTRAALVVAARTVFERDGFLGSRLTDITAEARCSTGTFYTYFTSKEEIFMAVLEAAKDDMLHPGMPHVAESDDPVSVIEASNRAYFEAYQRNAKLMMLQEQVATIDADFRQLRLKRSEAFAQRNAKSIQRLQQAGDVDPALDPIMTSRALSGMVGRLAYASFALGQDWSVDVLVETSTRLWANALGLSTRPTDG
ncbi:TetR/AcrR family transcriptional regulator [Aeromicrobium stalagmiti]|uniref:TetR/AcrR family transcriptional regulator n=1 Tax=Aeromicrobium stalagmiti TaxID=2738988 RepID=UPI0015686E52|nr:TetR/AcrR family transcriptional regulator [Aeromicrobium stalagmiti]NRQ49477.1 TetR/AcrR family transcriptional regulator [Aeromicrobium stalagmiti]